MACADYSRTLSDFLGAGNRLFSRAADIRRMSLSKPYRDARPDAAMFGFAAHARAVRSSRGEGVGER